MHSFSFVNIPVTIYASSSIGHSLLSKHPTFDNYPVHVWNQIFDNYPTNVTFGKNLKLFKTSNAKQNPASF